MLIRWSGLLEGLVLTNVEFIACLGYQPWGAVVIGFKILLKNKTNLLIFFEKRLYLRTIISFILLNKVLNVNMKYLSFRNRGNKYTTIKIDGLEQNH